MLLLWPNQPSSIGQNQLHLSLSHMLPPLHPHPLTNPKPYHMFQSPALCVSHCDESLAGIKCKQGMRCKYLELQLQYQFWRMNKDAEEGRGVHASQCTCVLPQEVVSNLAFRCLIWEVGGCISQGFG